MLWAGLPRLLPLVNKIVVQLQASELLPYLQSITSGRAQHTVFGSPMSVVTSSLGGSLDRHTGLDRHNPECQGQGCI